MALTGRRCDAARHPPEVRAGLQETGGLRVRSPALPELGAAAPRRGRCAVAGIMVFYFTSSSGEWAPRPRGPRSAVRFLSRDAPGRRRARTSS